MFGLFSNTVIFTVAQAFDKYEECPIDYRQSSSKTPKFSLANTDTRTSSTVLIGADKVKYLSSLKHVYLNGSAFLKRGETEIYGEQLFYNFSSDTAHFENSYASYKDLRFWSELAILAANEDMFYERTTFSRCEGPKSELAWQMDASAIEYDREDDEVNLYNSILRFYSIPVFYFPRINIPLSRRTGFLFSKVGQQRLSEYDWEGYFYQLPFFFDIAPNFDITTGFTWLQHRGLLLSNQLRYLAPWVNLEINYDWKEVDDVLRRAAENAKNYRRLTINTQSKFLTHWNLTTQWLDVSPRLFHDLFPSNAIEKPLSVSFNQQVKLKGDYGKHQYDAEVYQNISLKNEESDGYLGLPRLSYLYRTAFFQDQEFSFAVLGSRFVSPTKRNLRNYQYLQLKPTWQFSTYKNFYHSYAQLGLYRNHYQIDSFISDNQVVDKEETVDYSNGYAKIGGELYFNNTQSWFPRSIYAKLSPLAYYIYSPYKDPESIPFASYLANKVDTFRGLLQVNRYNREDFIGESNRVVSGISQSLFSHRWNLRATIGKNNDLEEPTTATSLPEFDKAFSYWFGEVAYNYELFRANINTQWEKLTDNSPKRIFSQVYYEDTRKNIFRLNYSRHKAQAGVEALETDITEIVGFGFSVAYNSFRFAYQTDYRLSDDRVNSSMLGLVYGSCCWQVSSIIEGKVATDDNSKMDYVINLGLTFKGMVSVGSVNNANETIYNAIGGNR
jgi:LPS-assembly protein